MSRREKFTDDEVKKVRHHRATRADHEQANTLLSQATHAPVTNVDVLMLSAKIVGVFCQNGSRHQFFEGITERQRADELYYLAHDISANNRH